jgi:diamine N-acetyltransferase
MQQQIDFIEIKNSDIAELQAICITTFTETFSSVNTPENIASYLNKAFSTQNLLTQIQNQNSNFYFAKINSEIVGYIKVNFGDTQTEMNEVNGMELERIYVLKAHQGKK